MELLFEALGARAGSANPRAVYSSKAVGEPPLLLANSVFFAIKDAVKAARASAGGQPISQLISNLRNNLKRLRFILHPRMNGLCGVVAAAAAAAAAAAVFPDRSACAGHAGYVAMDAPATPERIRLACADALTAPFAETTAEGDQAPIRAKLSV